MMVDFFILAIMKTKEQIEAKIKELREDPRAWSQATVYDNLQATMIALELRKEIVVLERVVSDYLSL